MFTLNQNGRSRSTRIGVHVEPEWVFMMSRNMQTYRSSGTGGAIRIVQLPFYKAKVDMLPNGVECIVATSDLQGREIGEENRLVGEAVAEELKLLAEIDEIPAIASILLAGDLYDYPDLRKVGGTGDVTPVWNAFARISPIVVGVHGNHDKVREADMVSNTYVLDGEIRKILGLRIGGISGIIGREDRNQRKSERNFEKILKNALTESTQVMLMHQGPDDPINDQMGNAMIREYMESKKGSALVVFGHCHWDTPIIDVGNNQVLNVDNRVVVLTE